MSEARLIEVFTNNDVNKVKRLLALKANSNTTIEALGKFTEGSNTTFSEDSICIPWDALKARYVREFRNTFQAELQRIQKSSYQPSPTPNPLTH